MTEFLFGTGGEGTALLVLRLLAIKGTLLLLVTALIVRLLRGAPASTRHLVWSAGLAGVLALPLLGVLVPQWRLALLPAATAPAAAAAAPSLAAVGAVGAVAGTDDPVVASPDRASEGREGSAHATAAVLPAEAPPSRLAALRDRLGAFSGADLLVMAWVLGVLAVLLRLTHGTVQVWRVARHAERVTDPDTLVLAQHLARRLGIRRPVILLEGEQRTVPVTWGIVYPVVLLPADVADWDDERKTLVLTHELAHVGRLDALSQVVAELAVALLWFNPLVWMAAHRARAERERACDDLVLANGTRASRYADDLLEIVRTLEPPRSPALAALAMARRSEFEGRLLAILDPRTPRGAVTARVALAAVAGVLLCAAPLAALTPMPRAAAAVVLRDAGFPDRRPAEGSSSASAHAESANPSSDDAASAADASASPAAASTTNGAAERAGSGVRGIVETVPAGAVVPANSPESYRCPAPHRSGSSLIHTQDDRVSLLHVKDGHCMAMRMEGRVDFTDDDRGVEGMARGAELTLQESRGDTRWRLELEGTGDGIRRRWFVNGEESRDLAAASTWMAELLPRLFTATGFNLERRIARLYRSGGVDAVLGALDEIEGDHATQKVLGMMLADSVALRDEQLVRIARLAGTIDGDHDRTTTLVRIAARWRPLPALREAYLRAATAIDSDYELKRTLTALLAADRLDAASLAAVVRAAGTMDSDYEKATTLLAVAKKPEMDDARVRERFLAVAQTIDGDHERGRVLRALLEAERVERELLLGVVAAARGMDGDYEKARVLTAVAKHPAARDAGVRTATIAAAREIDSEYERRKVLVLFVE